jgi:hypothetical protein
MHRAPCVDIMPPATLHTQRPLHVPPPIPPEARARRKSAPLTAKPEKSEGAERALQPNATIPLNLEDLILELNSTEGSADVESGEVTLAGEDEDREAEADTATDRAPASPRRT